MLAAGFFCICTFTLAALTPDYNVVTQSFSALSTMRHGWVESLNFIVSGILMFGFGLGLRKEMASGFGALMIPSLQCALGCAFIFMGPCGGPAFQRVLTLLILLGFSFELMLFACRFVSDERWKGWVYLTLLVAILMLVFGFLFEWSDTLKGPYTGVFERAMLTTRVIWTLFFSVRMLAGIRLDPPSC